MKALLIRPWHLKYGANLLFYDVTMCVVVILDALSEPHQGRCCLMWCEWKLRLMKKSYSPFNTLHSIQWCNLSKTIQVNRVNILTNRNRNTFSKWFSTLRHLLCIMSSKMLCLNVKLSHYISFIPRTEMWELDKTRFKIYFSFCWH